MAMAEQCKLTQQMKTFHKLNNHYLLFIIQRKKLSSRKLICVD